MKTQKTLLEKILERRVKPSPNQLISREALEEGEVLVQWVLGNIDSSEARVGLGLKANAQIHQKAGTSLRNLALGGYISISWNTPSDGSKDESMVAEEA